MESLSRGSIFKNISSVKDSKFSCRSLIASNIELILFWFVIMVSYNTNAYKSRFLSDLTKMVFRPA